MVVRFMTSRRRLQQAALAFALAAGVSIAGPVLAQGKVLKFVPEADLRSLDPIWTTAYITRNHGYMVYDVLFATDASFHIQPQMVDKYDLSADKLTYTFTLRDGLKFHDGAPVRSADCIASIERWAKRDALGHDERHVRRRLGERFERQRKRLLEFQPESLVVDRAPALGRFGKLLAERIAFGPAVDGGNAVRRADRLAIVKF